MSDAPETTAHVSPAERARAEREAELRTHVSDLTLTLIKAMLQTSYYSPDHPAAKGVAMEPFRLLKGLEAEHAELTFLLQGASREDELALEGVFDEAIPLSQLIRSTMGAHFAAKMRAYFARNRLISLSIKTVIEESEFDRFVAVFVERHLSEPGAVQEEPTRFTDLLLGREVVNVSVVVEDDLVGARRKLPWRVRMAIARLRKDLRVIPIYAKATRTELRVAKEMIIHDIIRPLTRPEFLKDLLVNCDLVQDVPELRGQDLESEIIATLSPQLLGTVAWALVSDLERLAWDKLKSEAERARSGAIDALKRNLRKVALRLAREESDRTQELIRHLFERKLLSFEELPPRLQQKIRVERWTDEFLADEDAAFERFEAAPDPKTYLEQLSALVAIHTELLRRERYDAVHRVISMMMVHAELPDPRLPDRAKLVKRAMRQLRNEETYGLVVHALARENVENRDLLREMAVMLGVGAVPRLLELLRTAESSAVRKDCVGAVIGIGPDAASPVLDDLRRHRLKWQYARTLLMVLGDLRCEAASSDLTRFAGHPNAKLREEALVSLFKLRGANSETQLLLALRDESPHIQRRALALLNQLDSRRPELAAYLARLLAPRDAKDEEETEPPELLQRMGIDTAERLGNVEVPEFGTLENVLALVVAHGERSPILRLIRGRTKPRAESLRVAACDALGRIGTRASEPNLRNAMKDHSEAVRQHADAALTAIRRRSAGLT